MRVRVRVVRIRAGPTRPSFSSLSPSPPSPSSSVSSLARRLSSSASSSASSAAVRAAAPQRNEPPPHTVPVVIVGGGTVGSCLSVLLARKGIDSLVVEERPPSQKDEDEEMAGGTPPPHPRAHVLHTRTMEVFRELGVEDAIHELAPPLSQWRHFRYLESMLGEEFGSVDFYRGSTSRWLRNASPATLSHLSQPLLDDLLEGIASRCGSPPFLGKIQRLHGYRGEGFEVVGAEGVATGVDVTLAPKNISGEANGETRTVSAQFLVAADGANSSTRDALGITLEGQTALQHFVSVHFTCEQLWPRLRELRRPGMLHFVFNRHVIGVLVAHDMEHGRWVAQFPYYPPHQTAGQVTAVGECERLIRASIGGEEDSGLDIIVHSADAWCMNALVAEEFSDPACRVFLCGDSAHQFPPSGGFGLNAGIQDAHNLAWKLASVIQGSCNARILESYTPERRLACQTLRDLSVDNFRRGLLVPMALGIPPMIPEMISNTLKLTPAEMIPGPAKKVLLETVLELGRSLNPVTNFNAPALPTRLKQEMLGRMRAVLDDFQALPLLFPRHDLGLEYTDEGSAIAGSPAPLKPRVVEGVEQYYPRISPGGRFPHFWISKENDSKASGMAFTSSQDVISRLSGAKSRWIIVCCNASVEDMPVSLACAVLQLFRPDVRKSSEFSSEGGGNNDSFINKIFSWFRPSGTEERDMKIEDEEQSPRYLEYFDSEGSFGALVRRAGCSDDNQPYFVLVRPDGVTAWCGENAEEAFKALETLQSL